jgi:hypothetical protein
VKQIIRPALIGLLCGIVSSPFLCLALRSVGLGPALGALLGIARAFAFFDLGSLSWRLVATDARFPFLRILLCAFIDKTFDTFRLELSVSDPAAGLCCTKPPVDSPITISGCKIILR